MFQQAANEDALTLVSDNEGRCFSWTLARKNPGCWIIEHEAPPDMKQGSSLFVNTTSESEYRNMSDIFE